MSEKKHYICIVLQKQQNAKQQQQTKERDGKMRKQVKVNGANWTGTPEYRLNPKEIEIAFQHAAKLVKWNRTSIAMAVATSTSDPHAAIEITKRLKAAF